MPDKAFSFVLVGVGGQGTVLASDVLAELGLRLGYDVKKAEVHGMSQRGGSVVSHVRWGPQVFSPIISRGEADFLIAFEKLEAARALDWLRPGGTLLVNDYRIDPVTVSSGDALYPEDGAIKAAAGGVAGRVSWIPASQIAEQLGGMRVSNVVLLGALAALLADSADPAAWDAALTGRIPEKYAELNRRAFAAGRDYRIPQPPAP